MTFIAYILSLFSTPTPQFEPGNQVNLVGFGRVERSDGVVVGQSSAGVLVEWARGGSSYERATTLCRIASV